MIDIDRTQFKNFVTNLQPTEIQGKTNFAINNRLLNQWEYEAEKLNHVYSNN